MKEWNKLSDSVTARALVKASYFCHTLDVKNALKILTVTDEEIIYDLFKCMCLKNKEYVSIC